MGTMSASDAAPLPRLGEVFFDVRGDSRTMRVSWYADTGVALFSIWQGDTCTGTFRLPIPELPRMVEALTKGPPDVAGTASRNGDPGLRQAGTGPPTAAMGPGSMPVPGPGQPGGDYPAPYRDHEQAPLDRGPAGSPSAGHPGFAPDGGYPDATSGPYQDLPGQRGYGGQDARYGNTAPAGYQDGPPTAGYAGTGPGGYGEPAPGGQHQPPAGYYGETAPEGHHDLPPAGYYRGFDPEGQPDLPPGHARSAPERYQDTRYQDAPPGSYGEPGSAAPGGYQDLPPGGGYQDLPPGSGYQDFPPGSGYRDLRPGTDYRTPGEDYREPPVAAADAGTGQFAGHQQDPYPPTGPLPVGRWRTGEPGGESPQALRPEDEFAPDRLGDGGSAPDRFASGEFARDGFAPDGFAGEGFAPDGFAPDGFAEDEGFADGDFPEDPLAGGYQGEAEQGYLPSPPTDMFPAASVSGGYHGQGSHRAGYAPDPDPDDPDRASQYPAGHADRGGPPRDSAAHRPGQSGAREREYGHSRGRS